MPRPDIRYIEQQGIQLITKQILTETKQPPSWQAGQALQMRSETHQW